MVNHHVWGSSCVRERGMVAGGVEVMGMGISSNRNRRISTSTLLLAFGDSEIWLRRNPTPAFPLSSFRNCKIFELFAGTLEPGRNLRPFLMWWDLRVLEWCGVWSLEWWSLAAQFPALGLSPQSQEPARIPSGAWGPWAMRSGGDTNQTETGPRAGRGVLPMRSMAPMAAFKVLTETSPRDRHSDRD